MVYQEEHCTENHLQILTKEEHRHFLSLMKYPLLPFLLLLVAAIAVGDRFMPYGPFRSSPEWPSEAVTRQGIVTQSPRESGNVVRMVLRLPDTNQLVQLTAVRDSAAAQSPQSSAPAATSSPTIPQVGDLVAFHTSLTPPRNAGNPGEVDYARYLRHQGITGQGFCFASEWSNLGPSSSLTFRERMLTLRSRVVSLYAQHFEGEALAIVSAMTLGDRSRVDTSLRELYNRCGASHVLALSGLHLSILSGLLALLFVRPLRRWGRVGERFGYGLLLLFLWAFVVFTGLPVSLVRAAVMFTLFVVLQQLRRNASPFHTLILTLILMLLWSPLQLFDIGLQLSAVAVAAILGLGYAEGRLRSLAADNVPLYLRLFRFRRRFENTLPRLSKVLQRRYVTIPLRAVLMLLSVSFVAQVATLPLTAHYFGRISLSGLFCSLVVIPMAYCILFGSILYLVLVPLRGVIASVLSAMLQLVHGALESTASLPISSFDVRLGWWSVAGLYILMLWLVLCLFRRYRVLRVLPVALLIVVTTVAGEVVTDILERPDPHIAIYNRPAHTEIHLVTPSADSILTSPSPHLVGHVLLFAQQSVAIVNEPMPYVPDVQLPPPLQVDVLLLRRGAKGHLADILLRYRPQVIALDGSLTDYYRRRFTEEASAHALPLYDISQQGALILPEPSKETIKP